MQSGTLYLVSTPIGNLGDITSRAVRTLQEVDLIACEDTRHSRPLLQHYGIDTPTTALHDHNEERVGKRLLQQMQEGLQLALISDAGTPLISDPGFQLVRQCHQHGLRVVPVPGASALLCALAASGLPTDRFAFEGFPPRGESARRSWFQALQQETCTLIFYEASHRIQASVKAAAEAFGADRSCALARELTKRHETLLTGTLAELGMRLEADSDQLRGEFVLLVAGAESTPREIDPATESMLAILLEELPLKQAAALAARISGQPKNRLYRHGLTLAGRH